MPCLYIIMKITIYDIEKLNERENDPTSRRAPAERRNVNMHKGIELRRPLEVYECSGPSIPA